MGVAKNRSQIMNHHTMCYIILRREALFQDFFLTQGHIAMSRFVCFLQSS